MASIEFLGSKRPVGRVALLAAALFAASSAMVLLDEKRALAADITVNTTVDEAISVNGNCTLREAIEAANTNAAVDQCASGVGADTVLLPAGTYQLTDGALVSTEELTIDGGGGGLDHDSSAQVIEGDGSSRLIEHSSSAPLTLFDLTLSGGAAGMGQEGGALQANGNVHVTDVDFVGNSAGSGGGAIRAQGTVLAEAATFDQNDGGDGDGGAIKASGAVTVQATAQGDPSFTGNTVAYPGRGGAIRGAGVTVTNTTFSDNTAGADGGAISSTGDVDVNGTSSFTDNDTLPGTGNTGHGGAIEATGLLVDVSGGADFSGNDAGAGPLGAFGTGGCISAATVVVGAGSDFDGNSAKSMGGCVFASTGATLTGPITFTGNSSASAGGALGSNGGGAITVSDAVFGGPLPADANSAATGGGAIAALANSSLTVSDSTVRNNTTAAASAGEGGGGIWFGGGTLVVADSTFAANAATGTAEGGALQTSPTVTSTITNSTFSANSEASGAGAAAINVEGNGALTLRHVTVTGSLGPGVAINNGGPGSILTFEGTVVADTATGQNCSGAVLDGPGNAGGDNLEDVDGGCPGDIGDPHLGPLGDNGGPTLTHRPQPGSPLIDTIANVDCTESVDQRGEPRPAPGGGDCDIGAVEVQTGTLSGTVTDLPAPQGFGTAYPDSQAFVELCPVFDPGCGDPPLPTVAGAFDAGTLLGGDHAARAGYCRTPVCTPAQLEYGPVVDVAVPEGGALTDQVLQIGFRSDVQAKRSRNTSYTDQDNYPGKPNVIALIKKNETTAFNVRLQNDGNLTEEIRLKGTLSGSNKFTVKFKDGNTVLGGMTTTGQAFTLAPGQIKNLRVTIQANANSVKGTSRTVTLTATSEGQSPVTKAPDQVGVRATRK